MQFTAKQARLASAIIAVLAVLVTLTPSKMDNQIVAVLKQLVCVLSKNSTIA